MMQSKPSQAVFPETYWENSLEREAGRVYTSANSKWKQDAQMSNPTIAVIGLGYVGLPVAVAFARAGLSVIGFDINAQRIEELRKGIDQTREVEPDDLKTETLTFTSDPSNLNLANFYIITVPTPIDGAKRPSLTALIKASETVGNALSKGDIVIYESTVYPGATEEDCIPVLEQNSGLKSAQDFVVGYSPERINPGDKKHRFETITKVVSAQTQTGLDEVARVYGTAVKAGIHKAPSIKVAEAAKVIENTQRDLNIALMNELSAIFAQLDIDTNDVLAAAATKWNFLPFSPGLVGGHCIGVDPYYLTHRAEMAGYHPEVILAGRRINDTMAERVARDGIRLLNKNGINSRKVAVLGVTFKENVPDTRNSLVVRLIKEFEAFGLDVAVHDPWADPKEVEKEFGITLHPLEGINDCGLVVLAVPHSQFIERGWELILPLATPNGSITMDIRACLERSLCPDGVTLWRP